MFSSALRTRNPWPTILPSLINLCLTQSTALKTTDLTLPGGISVLLITNNDDPSASIKRIDRAIQSGEAADVLTIIFLGSKVWEFQLLLDNAFSEPIYLVPLSTPQELPRVLERLAGDFKTTTVAVSEAERQNNWTPARMLSLMTTTNSHLSSHTALVLHSLFPSLQALAYDANEQSLEVLDNMEARRVIEFLDIEFVFGG